MCLKQTKNDLKWSKSFCEWLLVKSIKPSGTKKWPLALLQRGVSDLDKSKQFYINSCYSPNGMPFDDQRSSGANLLGRQHLSHCWHRSSSSELYKEFILNFSLLLTLVKKLKIGQILKMGRKLVKIDKLEEKWSKLDKIKNWTKLKKWTKL